MSQEGDSEELLGRIWCDRYQILEYVGRGGMGAVYKAKQVHIGREVALKVIHRRLCKDDKQIQRFEQEARTSSKLNHPNSIRVFDYGKSDDGRLFMAMEFLKGKTLGKLISENGTLPPRQVSHVARQMFKSLAEAHQLGLVHRDLKPENIFICDIFGETDFVKVLDFGIAKAIGPTEEDAKLTQTGFICGTPRYLSPEQALGQEVDGRADLYSVGVLMYEMLTGRPPFVGENPISIVMKHVHDEPPPMTGLERYGQEVQPLVQLISHLLQKNPARRPAPAERIVQFLDGTIDQAALMGSAAVDTATAQRRMPSSLQNLSGLTSPHLPSTQVTGSTSPPQYRDPSRDRPPMQPTDAQPSRVRRTRAPAPPPLPFEAMARSQGEGEAYDPQANATVLTARPEELLGATITEASRHSQDDFMPPTITEASPPSSQVTSVISRSSMQSSLDPKPPSSPTINIQKRPSEPARATIKRPDSDRARISQNVRERHPPKQAGANTQPTIAKPRAKAGPVWAWALAVLAVVSMVAYGLFAGDTPAGDPKDALPTQAASRVTVIPPAAPKVKETPPVASAGVAPVATPPSGSRPSGIVEPSVVNAPAPGARAGALLATAVQSQQTGLTPPVAVPAASVPAAPKSTGPSKRAEPTQEVGQRASKPPEAVPSSGGAEQTKPVQQDTAETKAKQPTVNPPVVPPAKAKAAPQKARKKKKRKPRAAVKPATESVKPKPKRRSKPKPKTKPKKKSVDFEIF